MHSSTQAGQYYLEAVECLKHGMLDEAERGFRNSLGAFTLLGDQARVAAVYEALGGIADIRGNTGSALWFLDTSRKYYEAAGDFARQQGDLDEAQRLRNQVVEVSQQITEIQNAGPPLPAQQVDVEIEKINDMNRASGALPVRPPLPQLHEQPAHRQQGPDLTQHVYEAFCTVSAFFLLGELVNDAPGLSPGVDKGGNMYKLLKEYWDALDIETKRWIVRLPETWDLIYTHWFDMPYSQRKQMRDFYRPNLEWFQERLRATEKPRIGKTGRTIKVPRAKG